MNVGFDLGYDLRFGSIIVGIGGDLTVSPFQCATSETTLEQVPHRQPDRHNGRCHDEKQRDDEGGRQLQGPSRLRDHRQALGLWRRWRRRRLHRESYSVNNSLASTNAIYRGSRNKTRVGYVFGAGAEYRITDFISASLEYNRYDFGTANFRIDASTRGNATASGESATAKTRITGDVFKAGLNLRF